MPRVFDNIDLPLLPALRETLGVSKRSDFCVGYFNLRGWRHLDQHVERWSGGEGACCRLLVGMQRQPEEQLRVALGVEDDDPQIDNQTAIRLKRTLAEDFRQQLALGYPTNEDEAGLRRLAEQLRAKKLVVKLFLRHPLHAKLYLAFRDDPSSPITGFLGSSNLTLSGLLKQGELNIDVLDHDATEKLAKWFEDRWADRWCVDISDELVKIIDESWASEDLVPPYHVYLKIAYHLSQDARAGLAEFRIPREFQNLLFEFQEAAVRIAAHHLNKRNGVVIGDVVGLGKTLMATALAKIFEDDLGYSTLIVCPKNLKPMWQDHVDRYGLRGKVMSVSKAIRELPNVPARFRLVLIDESHNLRNREGKTYRALHEYVAQSDSKCILLTATPYNKSFLDLSNQLRLFVQEDRDIGVRPERLLRDMGEIEFTKRHQCSPRSLAAFEKSDFADDWRDLMRLYLVRRTRSFIRENYAELDPDNGRQYLTFADGSRNYFPDRLPKTARFELDEEDADDQYAKLYGPSVVDCVARLELPRYGMANYVAVDPGDPPTQNESRALADLTRAGRRLMGFCRTNLFKRLESSGPAFLSSLERHILRNYIFLHALENGLPLPIGPQDAEMLVASFHDEDTEVGAEDLFADEDAPDETAAAHNLRSEEDFRESAAAIYQTYKTKYKKRFRWLGAHLFTDRLADDLLGDAQSLTKLLELSGPWRPSLDKKLVALKELLLQTHPDEKVLVFTQFADTVRYIETQLKRDGLSAVAGVTGGVSNPTDFAWRFSPVSNHKTVPAERELRVLVATDVLSEGQNLQDCAIVVNFDLPWAIIRLIQRAGRVDRIGQQAEVIRCYSFLPADGVDRILNLRSRVRQRLAENAEVVGTDEQFFEDDSHDPEFRDLFTEKAGILDGADDAEVDLSSQAFQIWKNAIEADPRLETLIPAMPGVVYTTKAHPATESEPPGVLAYLKTGQGNDAMVWMNRSGQCISESLVKILNAARCEPDTPALPRHERHHELVRRAVACVVEEEKSVGGQLGRPSGARFRTYERLKHFIDEMEGTLFDSSELRKAVEEIYRFPLRQTAVDVLNRQLRSGIADEDLAALVVSLREDNSLCLIQDDDAANEPHIICSMGLTEQ